MSRVFKLFDAKNPKIWWIPIALHCEKNPIQMYYNIIHYYNNDSFINIINASVIMILIYYSLKKL